MGDLFFSTPMSDLFAGLEDEEGFEFSLSGKKGGLSDLFGGSPRTAAKKEAPASKPSPAPSSPKQTESRPKQVAAPPSVVYEIAGIVCHKYNQEEKKYDLIGKIGVAILNSSNVFQLLLYRSNEDHVTQVPISPNFQFVVQNESYASFADARKQNWSIKFPTLESVSLFCMHLTIIKAALSGFSNISIQDINSGSGEPIQDGDNVEIKYSTYLIQPGCKVGKLIDSNISSDKPLRLNVGSGEQLVSGVHQGAKGMLPKGGRIVVVPSNLAYGPEGSGNIPGNTHILYQIDRVKKFGVSMGGDSLAAELQKKSSGESQQNQSIRKEEEKEEPVVAKTSEKPVVGSQPVLQYQIS